VKQRDKKARRVARPRDAQAEPPPATGPEVNDMNDTPAELEGYAPSLRDALARFQETCAALFGESDESALRQQRRHRRVVRAFSVAGTLAVVFSILHLTRLLPLTGHKELTEWLAFVLLWGEAVAVVVAVGAVLYGVILSSQGHWLAGRHKAEMLRLLKFKLLLDPSLISGGAAGRGEWEAKLDKEFESIEQIEESSLHAWAWESRVPNVPLYSPGKIDADITRDVLDYYRRKRLDPQRDYFSEQAMGNLRWDRLTRRVPPLLFFGSVLFAVAHLLVEFFEIHGRGWEDYYDKWAREPSSLAVGCIILAAILPTFGAGLRGWRSAYEFSRNTLRFHSLQLALEELQERLERGDARPEEIWRDLWWCEWLLEAEHREWLRLMIEAEWIG
jgi:hypothetical protein